MRLKRTSTIRRSLTEPGKRIIGVTVDNKEQVLKHLAAANNMLVAPSFVLENLHETGTKYITYEDVRLAKIGMENAARYIKEAQKLLEK